MRAYYSTFNINEDKKYKLVKFEGCCDLVKGLEQYLNLERSDSNYAYCGSPYIGNLVWDPIRCGLEINASYDEYGSNFENIKFCPNCGAPVELIEVE